MPKLLSKQESGLGSLSSKYWKTEEERNLPIEAKEGLRSRTGLKLVEGVLGCDQQQDGGTLGSAPSGDIQQKQRITQSKRQKGFCLLKLSFLQKMLWT
jgi:hypothetical protein